MSLIYLWLLELKYRTLCTSVKNIAPVPEWCICDGVSSLPIATSGVEYTNWSLTWANIWVMSEERGGGGNVSGGITDGSFGAFLLTQRRCHWPTSEWLGLTKSLPPHPTPCLVKLTITEPPSASVNCGKNRSPWPHFLSSHLPSAGFCSSTFDCGRQEDEGGRVWYLPSPLAGQ